MEVLALVTALLTGGQSLERIGARGNSGGDLEVEVVLVHADGVLRGVDLGCRSRKGVQK